jgi:hypothetical protein
MVFILFLGYVGHHLVETLRNDHYNDIFPKRFIGTISRDEPDNPIHPSVAKTYNVIF